MPPLVHKLVDVLVAVALTSAVAFGIIILNSFLMARGSSWHGFNLWMSFIARPDILGTMILTALVTVGYGLWQQRRRSPLR